ncbi:MAG: hypothetical protein H6729_03565 [Deltaproteobacteria bacterium]|nr:hypothetical protein [Deltaproteobacteria bacterium]
MALLHFGRALNNFSNQQLPLSQFLADGRVPIDNGVVERHWPSVLAAHSATCALCGIDPVEYLATVMPILARGVIEKDVIDLLPCNFTL